jgi:hypothetical protein
MTFMTLLLLLDIERKTFLWVACFLSFNHLPDSFLCHVLKHYRLIDKLIGIKVIYKNIIFLKVQTHIYKILINDSFLIMTYFPFIF